MPASDTQLKLPTQRYVSRLRLTFQFNSTLFARIFSLGAVAFTSRSGVDRQVSTYVTSNLKYLQQRICVKFFVL